MRCGNCGNARREANRRFCANCGKPFSNVAPTVIDDSLTARPAARPPPSHAIATLLTSPPRERPKGLFSFLLRALVSIALCYGATSLVGYVTMTYAGEAAKNGPPQPPFLVLAFVTNAVLGYAVGGLLKPRAPTNRAIVVAGAALLLSLGGGAPLARAEVPEHNPGLDHQCRKGTQWSRGPVACKQTDCPAGAGRTYTYDCSCGETWGRPVRTCYGEGGLVTKCVAAGTPCEDPSGKLGGGFFIFLGGFTWYCAAISSAPLTGSFVMGGLMIGAGAWLWNRGRPGPLKLGRAAFEAKVRQATENAKKAVDGLNSRMRGGLSEEDLGDLGVVYESWLNATPQQKEQLRQELAKEGVDIVRLGDALRYQKDGTLRAD